MIDIHSHVLPNLDDGSKSLEMTHEMFRQYKNQGINKIICTPHQNLLSNHFLSNKIIDSKFNEVLPIAKEYGLDLYLGSEIYYSTELFEALKNNQLLTLNNSKYILLEFSRLNETNIEDIIYEINLMGYKVIIAHIEKYFYLSIKDILLIKNKGALLQVNADSFNNRKERKKIFKLLKKEAIDFIATDAHNDISRNVSIDYVKKIINKKFPKQFNKFFIEELF